MNRITKAIEITQTKLATRIKNGELPQKQADKTHKQLDFQWDEYVKFQELKSLAVVEGTLSTEEGMTIYKFLGESGPEFVNKQSLEVKIVLTQLFAKLLGNRIAAYGAK
jgi:hypothetical protein